LEQLTITEAQAPEKPAKATKPRKKKKAKAKRPRGASTKPLPPPVPVPATPPDPGPLGMGAIFQQNQPEEESADSFASSSISEPKPGEPLGEDSERMLRSVPASIDDDDEVADQGASPAASPAAPAVLLPSGIFSEDKTRKFLEEAFHWLADRFDSAHWELTENQSDLLAGPCAQLFSSVWAKLIERLPEWLAGTPGAADLMFAATIVIGPKIAMQMTITRERRARPKVNRPANGPQPVAARSQPGPVGPIDTAPLEPFPTDRSFE
jgi:hypothetical protein